MNTAADTVTLTVDGRRVVVPAHASVAAALVGRDPASLGHGRATWHVRTSASGRPRGPLCGMGICFECRATVDGRPQERTCQITVRDGMEIRTDG